MTGGAGLMDMNGLPGGKSSELEDKQKEQEEADFSFNPDDLEKWVPCCLYAGQSDIKIATTTLV